MSRYPDYSLNILISYAYYTKQVDEYLSSLDINFRLVIDSGAFTVWKKGKEIALKDYCKFLRSIKMKPWRYFNLDVIGDPQKTNFNYDLMLKEGFNPIPIFTRGEDFAMLDKYYETSDVVGLGGLVGTKGNKNAVKRTMKHVHDRKVHWLGFTSLQFLKHYRPYMCDSSSASSFSRFGGGAIYIGNGKVISVNRDTFKQKPPSEIQKAFDRWQIPISKISKKDFWKTDDLDKLGYSSAINLMLDVKKNLGVNMFLAISNFRQLKIAVNQFKKLQRII